MNIAQPTYKKAFERLPDKKRDRILWTAIRIFSDRGFSGANINVIAEQADISIGAMYNYFETKEDLFLTVVEHLHDVLARELFSIDLEGKGFFAVIEAITHKAVESAITMGEMTKLYLNITAENLPGLEARLTDRLEGVTIEFYRQLVEGAQASGEIAADVDTGMLCFVIDNEIMALQRSYATTYYRERLGMFLGSVPDTDEVVARTMAIIRSAARGSTHA